MAEHPKPSIRLGVMEAQPSQSPLPGEGTGLGRRHAAHPEPRPSSGVSPGHMFLCG